MGHMEDALGGYKPASAEDVFVIPQRREAKAAEESLAPVLGQHGGGAANAPGAADAHSGAASEPVPQRDDPDDGEHTDSTEEEVLARAAREAAAAAAAETPEEKKPEPVAAEEVVAPAEPEPETPLLTGAAATPVSVTRELAAIKGSSPRPFEKVGYSAGDGVEMQIIKKFPTVLIDRLRLTLAPAVGGEFAAGLSNPAIITAFLIAKTGLELDVDTNTAVAVDVFRQVDPRLLAVEEKMNDTIEGLQQLGEAMKHTLKRVTETSNTVDNMEYSTAFLVADRVAVVTTPDTNETNVDVTGKKVLQVREQIRARSKAQRIVETRRDGRRLS